MKPKRTRRRQGRGWSQYALVLLAALVVVSWVGVPATSYTATDVSRGSNVDIVADSNGALGLNTSAGVDTGQTDTLFELTNQLGQNASVTITLASGSTSTGDLVVDGVNEGDEATFDLSQGNAQSVGLAVPCDSSLVGSDVTYTVNASAESVDGTATRMANITDGNCETYRVVFVNKTEQNVTSIAIDGGTEQVLLYRKAPEIGPGRTSLDSDSTKEVPYVDEHNIEAIGFGETFVDTYDSSGRVNNQPIGIGDYDGDGKDEVYYNREKSLYATRAGESPTKVVDSGNFSPQLTAVAGVADFDGDGAVEIVFANNNNGVGYVDAGTPTTTGYQNLGSAQSIGRPADFDGDGDVRVPVVTSSNQVALVDSDGTATVLNSNYGQAGLDSVAAHDIDGDDTLEVVFADTANDLHYMELDGSHAKVRNANGNVVSANANQGAA